MSAETPIFSINTGLFPLNTFMEFPEDKRGQILEALEAATDVLPSENRLHWVRQNGGSEDVWAIEKRYGEAADIFAYKLDPNFDPQNWGENSTEILELRGRFYQMIRTLSLEQITNGLRVLRTIN